MLLARGMNLDDQGQRMRSIRNYAKSVGGLIAIVAVIFGIGMLIQRHLDVRALRQLIEGLGILAPLTFIALVFLKNILFLPVLPIVAIIGIGALVFGETLGALYSWVGMSGGSCIAFLAARCGAGRVAARFKSGNLQSLNEIVSTHGFLSILGLRLVLFGNTALNYLSGLTSITLRDYTLGTLIGLLPRTIVVASVVDTLQEPNIWRSLFSYPDLLWFPLLIVSWAGGVWLLAFVAKDWASIVRQTNVCGRAVQTVSALLSGKFHSK
jgi:uncharacterized membrane protein YdjX (TVP38/TMEM64 family)